MCKLFGANVRISSLKGLSAEIAKNLILAGVKSISLHDERDVELWNLSTNFYFSKAYVGRNRALACISKLQELNTFVLLYAWTSLICKEQLSNYQAARIIASISNGNPTLASCIHDEEMDFAGGVLVMFTKVEGITESNDGKPKKIKDTKPCAFLLEGDMIKFSAYARGGIVPLVKRRLEVEDIQKLETIDENVLRHFASGLHAVLSPMATILSGIVGQEVVKAYTRKFHPIVEFFYFDSLECLPPKAIGAEDVKLINICYDAQVSIFRQELQAKLLEAKLFVVRAGALGCEFLENLALIGASWSGKGKLTITDDDEDISWKVRRVAAKCLSAMIISHPKMISKLYTEACLRLIERFKEQKENVKMDVINAFIELLHQTGNVTKGVGDPKI
eukprot:Gb_32243 [translate_table: standard]